MSRSIAQEADVSYVVPPYRVVPAAAKQATIALDSVVRYIDNTTDQTVVGEVPPTG
jgi:hypothetical protein